MASHKMGPSRLNHGHQQCVYCAATDLEIAYAIGPVCRSAPQPKPAPKLPQFRVLGTWWLKKTDV